MPCGVDKPLRRVLQFDKMVDVTVKRAKVEALLSIEGVHNKRFRGQKPRPILRLNRKRTLELLR